jgi:beta-lactamase regulating signal transducer with metallopeptidase domain
MGLFFIHIIKSSLCLIIFYLSYKALLSKETFYKVNRFILLVIIIASILLPFFEMTVSQPAVATVPEHFKNMEQLLLQKKVHLKGFSAETNDGFYSLLFFTYIIGALIQLFITIGNFLKIYQLARRSTQVNYEGYILAVTPQEQSPFSWGRYIVLSKDDYNNQPEIIIQHELIHLKRYHSVDLLIAELASIIFWFNPTIWLLKKEMKDIHEFEVDDTLLKQGVDAKEYQLLLIKKAVGEKLYSVANTFNQSSLSKRIRMMLRKKSNPWAQLKYLCIVVLTLFSVIVFARPEVTAKLKGISSDKLGKFIKKQVATITQNPVAEQPAPEKAPVKASKKPDVKPAVEANNEAANTPAQPSVTHSPTSPLCMVNGKETNYAEFQQIDPNTIKTVKVLKEKEAVGQYGDKGRNGAVIITTNFEQVISVDVSIPTTNNTPIYIFFAGDKQLEPAQQVMLNKNLNVILSSPRAIKKQVELTGKAATDKYGSAGANGIIEVYMNL